MKIFVGGLSADVTDASFREYFSKFGTITDSTVCIIAWFSVRLDLSLLACVELALIPLSFLPRPSNTLLFATIGNGRQGDEQIAGIRFRDLR
jgi:RNA recognition motif-containing protein